MACLYVRKNRLWLKWYANGRPHHKATGLLEAEWEKGLRLKAEVEAELKARKALGLTIPEDKTVGAWKRVWLNQRREAGIASAHDDEVRLRHVAELDGLVLADVRPRHVRPIFVRLARGGTIANRTVRHVAGVLHRMFEDARVDELIESNPVVFKRGELPGKEDKNPEWRATAVYSREEVEALISDARIPRDRRVLYALLFLTGMRIGEVSDRRWKDIDWELEPLPRLLVHSSWSTKGKVSKSTKTKVVRRVPMHPALVEALAWWLAEGWPAAFGRRAEPEDLILPRQDGTQRSATMCWFNLQDDLDELKLRRRRTHDARRTFISLALADGARESVLKWVTHGPSGNVMDLYNTVPWAALCREVSLLNIKHLEFGDTKVTSGIQEGANPQ